MKEEIPMISYCPSIRSMSFPGRKNLTWAPNVPAVRGPAPSAPSLPRNLRYQARKTDASPRPACDLSLLLTCTTFCGCYKSLSKNEEFNPWASFVLFRITATQRASFLPYRFPRHHIQKFCDLHHLESWNQT